VPDGLIERSLDSRGEDLQSGGKGVKGLSYLATEWISFINDVSPGL
jgi:hypothetical protein